MPIASDNVTNVVAAHHNNQSDAIIAIETKVGTGASTPAANQFLKGNGVGTSAWSTISSSDVPDLSATYAPTAKGVTNGDTHNHDGGDGGQIDHTKLASIGTNTHAQIDTALTRLANTSNTNTGDQVVPANEAGSSNNFLTAYNSTTGAWTKARPTWANIDKTTSSIADITTRSHTALTDIGTNTHVQIDTHIAGKLSVHAATTSAELAGVISDETGSGKLVFDTSPTLTTPTIDVVNSSSSNDISLVADTANAKVVKTTVRRQGGSATDFSSAGSTNYTESDVFIQMGAAALASGTNVITFPVAFSQVPIVIATPRSAAGNYPTGWYLVSEATNQFAIQSQGTYPSSITWLAIGKR